MKLQKPQIFNYIEALQGKIEHLPKEMEETYAVMKLGYDVESEFARLLHETTDCWWIHDLQIKNQNKIQFDFIVINDETIIQFEIKNFSGDYFYEKQKLYRSTGFVSKDLINQFEVANDGLVRMIDKLKIDREVKSYIVFINPTFTLHGDLRKRVNILLRSELYKLDNILGTNFKYGENQMIYEMLKSLNQPFLSQFDNYKLVDFDQVNTGIKCIKCKKLIEPNMFFDQKKYVKCNKCGDKIGRNHLIIQALKELYILKGKPISVKDSVEWTGISKAALKRILYSHFSRVGQNKASKYIYIERENEY
ncbi:nuclease-related domain-containing protein [Mammaliicoccus sp. Dog046]|uniref:nuclease-related domain-containing protein n=1 Tax=Mammaliicoccus sp. Dog046 TaxID=3034233 RepID=UPI002B2589C4|nr:nuclease-related domain-containing protein [Mammaliicoccus sp. Dog046]WQK84863.1 nuclease-related domain-containing protein [Mammaliicoccus sp. Dog046]